MRCLEKASSRQPPVDPSSTSTLDLCWMLPSASVLACEERVQKAVSVVHHERGDAGVSASAEPSQRPKMRLCGRPRPVVCYTASQWPLDSFLPRPSALLARPGTWTAGSRVRGAGARGASPATPPLARLSAARTAAYCAIRACMAAAGVAITSMVRCCRRMCHVQLTDPRRFSLRERRRREERAAACG